LADEKADAGIFGNGVIGHIEAAVQPPGGVRQEVEKEVAFPLIGDLLVVANRLVEEECLAREAEA